MPDVSVQALVGANLVYIVRDKRGLVHYCYDTSWQAALDWNERDSHAPVDETFCQEENYFTTVTGVHVTCIICLAIEATAELGEYNAR